MDCNCGQQSGQTASLLAKNPAPHFQPSLFVLLMTRARANIVVFVPGVCVELSILSSLAGVLGVAFCMGLCYPRRGWASPNGQWVLVWAG